MALQPTDARASQNAPSERSQANCSKVTMLALLNVSLTGTTMGFLALSRSTSMRQALRVVACTGAATAASSALVVKTVPSVCKYIADWTATS